jgi:hypothetical protein
MRANSGVFLGEAPTAGTSISEHIPKLTVVENDLELNFFVPEFLNPILHQGAWPPPEPPPHHDRSRTVAPSLWSSILPSRPYHWSRGRGAAPPAKEGGEGGRVQFTPKIGEGFYRTLILSFRESLITCVLSRRGGCVPLPGRLIKPGFFQARSSMTTIKIERRTIDHSDYIR